MLQAAPSRVRAGLIGVGQYHFDASGVLTPTVTFVVALVPLIVVAPKEKAGLPPETATGLLPGGGVVALPDGSLPQPTITIVAEMTPAMTAYFIKRNSAQLRWSAARDYRRPNSKQGRESRVRCTKG